ncbi:hypothetical protein Taro_010486 [Colocasia esculenta]|uniref:Uncharacterized protein n=1 Tax=Colocasia esculenta TaxID=4460 RepID=A0A843U3R0_COLES|nr:hypothetical protein [Colocasia esculenta]
MIRVCDYVQVTRLLCGGFVLAIRANHTMCDGQGILLLLNAKVPFLIPAGYYSNDFTFPTAVSAAGELCHNSLAYAVHLIQRAKADMTEEYERSVADLMVLRGRPHFTEAAGTWMVSDLTRIKFRQVDLGWGDAVYGGLVEAGDHRGPGQLLRGLQRRDRGAPPAAAGGHAEVRRCHLHSGMEADGRVDDADLCFLASSPS